MSVIARFEVIPVRDGSMSTAIADALRALDQYPVSYQTTATGTVIEADSVEQLFTAVQAAHQAIREDRVITSIEIDEDRRRPQNMTERVASVERELGHPPQRTQPTGRSQRRQQPTGKQQSAHTQSRSARAQTRPADTEPAQAVTAERHSPGRPIQSLPHQ